MKKIDRTTRTDEERAYACWLYSVPGIGGRTMEAIAEVCSCAREFYEGGDALWKRFLNARQLEQMRECHKNRDVEGFWEEHRRGGIRFLTREDADYPTRLQNIPDPPYAVFVKGRLPEEDKISVAVVGARECSPYGEYIASELGKRLGQRDIPLISGMARGIDGISQRAAVESGGCSYAVLGSGVDVCYPASNQELYAKLETSGGILSSYPIHTEAVPGNFPPRNRIVSGLADVLVVVEARQKSGTLITVDMALEQGKEVYAVPGRITDRLSDGCNGLIRQGAGMLLSPDDFIRELGRLEESLNLRKSRGLDPANAKKTPASPKRPEDDHPRGEGGEESEDQRTESDILMGILDFEPLGVEDIAVRFNQSLSGEKSVQEVFAMLMKLVLTGRASQLSPGCFARLQEP